MSGREVRPPLWDARTDRRWRRACAVRPMGANLAGVREMLDEFRKSRPGKRFQDHYRRKRASAGGTVWRCMAMAAGVLLFLAGIVFLAIPGPGIPILAAGAALLAQQSRGVAELLDRAELRLRRLLRRR